MYQILVIHSSYIYFSEKISHLIFFVETIRSAVFTVSCIQHPDSNTWDEQIMIYYWIQILVHTCLYFDTTELNTRLNDAAKSIFNWKHVCKFECFREFFWITLPIISATISSVLLKPWTVTLIFWGINWE